MSKYTFNSIKRWQPSDTDRTSASLIVQSNAPTSPFSAKKLKLDDLFNRKNVQGINQQAQEDQKKSFYHPLPSPKSKNIQIAKKFSDQNEERNNYQALKKDKPLPFKPLNSKERILKRQGALANCKSQKTLPSFLRNQSKSPDRRKDKNLKKEDFQIIQKLGEGKFGSVFLAREIHTNFIIALKSMNKRKIIQDNLLGQFIRELKLQTFLDHPNIIKCFGYFADEQNFYVALQLGSDGELYHIIESGSTLSEESTSYIIGNLLNAVSLMHKHKILHRDIKPENVVLVHGNVKLCDFGWAVNKKSELRSTFCGTPLYLSPEILKGQKYDEKVDLWAIGIMAFELHLGCSPFEINQQEDLQKIVTQAVIFPEKASPCFREFITQILKKDPKERQSCQDLLKLDFIRHYHELQSCEELCQ